MEDDENTYENVALNKRAFRSSSRRVTDTSTEEATDSGGKVIRLVLFLFGLLCIIHVALNIGLRLYFYEGFNTKYKNSTAERDELQKKYSNLQTSHQNLSKERDKLRRKLENLTLLLDSYSDEKWRLYRGSFYLGSPYPLSWQDSRQYCQDKGADLIIINSIEEQKFTRIFGLDRWIGLSDAEDEGVWKWVDGLNLTTSFWRKGEPNNHGGKEDCVELRQHDSIEIINWNDLSCETKIEFICEKKV